MRRLDKKRMPQWGILENYFPLLDPSMGVDMGPDRSLSESELGLE
jgi:hypothetical protein